MRSTPVRAMALGLAGLALGCLTRSPAVEFYTLGASEASSDARAAEGAPAVVVGPLSLPRYLDRPQLARRSEGNRIVYDETRRWAGPLGGEVLRVLGANLMTLIPSDRVVAYPIQPPFPVDYRVLIEIERFEAGAGDVVTLHARWSILPGSGGSAISLGRVALEEPAASGKPADIVAAHSAAAAGLSRALAGTLRSLAETRQAPAREAADPVSAP